MDILVMVGQLILSLSILVVLHEFGHFLPAKWFKTRVEKFYLFFDPWFSLLKFKKGDTEYGVGWLPLGGYVKISGMIDESMDKEQMKQPAQPWEFRSKPAWQRLIIMLGGVTVNFILGFLIFGALLYLYGEEFLPSKNVVHGIHVDSLGFDMGLRNGDQIISIGASDFEKFSERDVVRQIVINNASSISVRRSGQIVDVPIDEKFIRILSSSDFKNQVLFMERIPYVAGKLVKDSPAEKAGIQVGDSIVSLNGNEYPFFDQFAEAMKGRNNEEVRVGLYRDNNPLTVNITTSEDGKLGIYRNPPIYFFDTERLNYSLLSALPAGVVKGWDFLTDQIKAFGQMFRGKIKASESLGGFVTITKLFPTTWVWESFWRITAILSLILGFMNLLPIPALDGGHVMFLIWEVITGRKLSDKFMEYATYAGFIIVIALLLFANGLDILRLFK